MSSSMKPFPMVYDNEPSHSPLLRIQCQQPYNAEPSSSDLVEFTLTPHDLVYCRNHGPVREFDDEGYLLQLTYPGKAPTDLPLKAIKENFEKITVVAALQCAGNRRNEMGRIKKVSGVGWDDGVVANCSWGGARLLDVLRWAGLEVDASWEGWHICFASHATLCQDDDYYGASVPAETALGLENDVILAYEMNGEPLSAEHGGPLRLVVPGYLGARWVKWLDTIAVSQFESPNFYQQRDYKILPPEVETKAQAQSVWSKCPSMTSLPLNAVVASITQTRPGSLYVKGYAVPDARSQVARVQVSADDGATWIEAVITYQEGKWSWTLWEAELEECQESGEVVCRAISTNGSVQKRECEWNMRGVAYNGWNRKRW